MAVKKKLVIKKKKGKLVIHKKAVDETPEPTEEDVISSDASDDDNGIGVYAPEGTEQSEAEKPKPKKKLIKKKSKVAKEVTGKVEISHTSGAEVTASSDTEKVADVEVEQHMANVGYNMARTINLGDYESVKIAVSINVPSLVDVDEINGNFDFAKEWVEEKLTEIVDDYTGD